MHRRTVVARLRAAEPGRDPRGRRRRRSRPRPRPMRSRPRSGWRVADRRPAGRPRSPPARGPRPTCSPAARTRRGPIRPPGSCSPHRSPTGAARPNRAAGCAGPADPRAERPVAGRNGRRRPDRPPTRSRLRPPRPLRSLRPPPLRPHWIEPRRPSPGPPRAAPNPGRSGRRETRSTGSTPPGERARAAPAAIPRSSDGDGRDSASANRDRHRTRRTGRPGHRPCWAALAQSSPAMIPAQPTRERPAPKIPASWP